MAKFHQIEDDYINCYDNIKSNFQNMVNKYISDNDIEFAIFVSLVALEDDLGIEFDSKEKIKELWKK